MTDATDTEADSGTQTEPQPPGPSRNPVVAVVVVVGLMLAALVALFAFSDSGDGPDTSEQVLADTAPPLAGTTTAGEEFDIRDQAGRWVVVNFFATWCPPCVAEHPELVEFALRNPDEATVVSVAFDEPAPVIEQFFVEHGGDWPVVADAASIPLDWGVLGLPESFVVSPDGVVVEKIEGGVTADQLEELIAAHGGAGSGGSGEASE